MFTEESVDISFVTELWMVQSNPLHIRELERRSNLNNIDFVCNARVARRGGGVAVAVNTARGYNVKKLQVNCTSGDSRLEIVWCYVIPPKPVDNIKGFICVCLYSPPRSRLNDQLLEHLQFNLNGLTASYPDSRVIIGGMLRRSEIAIRIL